MCRAILWCCVTHGSYTWDLKRKIPGLKKTWSFILPHWHSVHTGHEKLEKSWSCNRNLRSWHGIKLVSKIMEFLKKKNNFTHKKWRVVWFPSRNLLLLSSHIALLISQTGTFDHGVIEVGPEKTWNIMSPALYELVKSQGKFTELWCKNQQNFVASKDKLCRSSSVWSDLLCCWSVSEEHVVME